MAWYPTKMISTSFSVWVSISSFLQNEGKSSELFKKYIDLRITVGKIDLTRDDARAHSGGSKHHARTPGEQIDLPSSLELSELTEAYNIMSSQLRQERDHLETRVVERTEELDSANLELTKEIDKHKMTITELEDTLREIKTLRGILPICSHCKKIRDDKGYWDQIESYIKNHSEADFTHGICPECMNKFYGDYSDDKE